MSKKRIVAVSCLGLVVALLIAVTVETKGEKDLAKAIDPPIGRRAIDPPIGR